MFLRGSLPSMTSREKFLTRSWKSSLESCRSRISNVQGTVGGCDCPGPIGNQQHSKALWPSSTPLSWSAQPGEVDPIKRQWTRCRSLVCLVTTKRIRGPVSAKKCVQVSLRSRSCCRPTYALWGTPQLRSSLSYALAVWPKTCTLYAPKGAAAGCRQAAAVASNYPSVLRCP